ncbi:MAG: DUF4173 domain-containing protein [Defluviitaleaceae bacterium]|nr:DUF4173 domain-containing protein [Defluviitaleaceae bacterium]
MEMHEVLAPRIESKAKVYSKAEKLLLPAALIIAIFFDRLIINRLYGLPFYNAIFWLSYLGVFYTIFWKKVKNDYVLWFVTACTAALCVWNLLSWEDIIYSGRNLQYTMISLLVIPGVLMAHAQWTAHSFSWKSFDGAVIGMVLAWLEGWFIKPFTGLGEFFGISVSLISRENKPVIKRALLGFLIVFLMMLFIIPLLMGADQVFSLYVSRIFSQMQLSSIALHGMVVLIAFGLFYSFLWNIGFSENKTIVFNNSAKIDNVISGIVLGSVILVYTLFCAVQFTYLFARAGLPQGVTFAEYAREGFAQTVTVCAINLLIFGVFLWRGKNEKLISILLGVLLALTGVMLVSGAIRLNLYIGVFGITWLRLLSAWFIIYLTAVLILCVLRLFRKEMPVMGICALLLLIWYVALGYLNPDGFISWYNTNIYM